MSGTRGHRRSARGRGRGSRDLRVGAATAGQRRWGTGISPSLLLAGVVLLSRPGWAGDGVLALQTAAPSCRNQSSAIYVDCGNGTVTDNRTGLVWLANANCFGQPDWFLATATVGGLADLDAGTCAALGLTAAACDCGLSDGSSPGEWRLPTISEWQTMISDAFNEAGFPVCYPTITNDSGKGCWVDGPSSFTGVVPGDPDLGYWSSTSSSVGRAYFQPLDGWPAFHDGKSSSPHYIWPVRGGQ